MKHFHQFIPKKKTKLNFYTLTILHSLAGILQVTANLILCLVNLVINLEVVARNQSFTPADLRREEEAVTFQSPCSAFSSLSILPQNGTEIKEGVTSGAVSVGAECGASQRRRIAQKGALDPKCQKMLFCDGTIECVARVFMHQF